MRLINLSVSVDTPAASRHTWEKLSEIGKNLTSNGFDATVSSHSVSGEVEDEETQGDSKRMLTFKVHTILRRLGLTETEAWTAITEIHEANIIFATKEA